MTAVLAYYILKEMITKADIIAIIVVFIGIILVQNPFGASTTATEHGHSLLYEFFGSFIAFIGAVLGGITAICIR